MAGNPEPETQNDAESSDRPESAASPVFLRDFSISNFKSLADFEMTGLGQFVCLVGLNGSGKTSVLQALDFLAQLAGGTVRRWLLDKGWTWDDLKTSSLGRDTISFKLNLSTMGNQETFGWEGDYLISQNACAREEIRINGVTFLRVADKVLERAGDTTDLKPFDYRGSILAMLSVEYEPYFPVFRIKEFLREMKLLGLLSPEQMRQESGFSEDIGPGGERLPGYLGNLEAKKRAELLESVRVFYPELLGIDTVTTRAGLTTMVFHENYRGPGKDFSGTVTGAWHINDGLLRI